MARPLKNLVWLASYPKAGNTWFRIFLHYLILPAGKVDLDRLHLSWMASSRVLVKEWSGLDTADLTPAELWEIRMKVWARVSQESDNLAFVKIHDAMRAPGRSEDLVPEDSTKAAIYFVRNPLDGCLSMANHMGWTVDESIDRMAKRIVLADAWRGGQLPQDIQDWSFHVTSWLDSDTVPVMLLRYEDMKRDSEESFYRAVRFLDLPFEGPQVRAALEQCAFDRLKKREKEEGFRERPRRSGVFFRKAKVGEWKKELTSEQVRRVVDAHGPTMCRLGYLNDAGEPNELILDDAT